MRGRSVRIRRSQERTKLPGRGARRNRDPVLLQQQRPPGGGQRPGVDGARSVEGWTGEAHFAADQQAAIKLLTLERGDVVLVKGSRYRTWDVADALRPEGVRP